MSFREGWLEEQPRGVEEDLLQTAGLQLSGSAAILCKGGLDVIRKEAWSFYRTTSGARLCWSSKNLQDLKEQTQTGVERGAEEGQGQEALGEGIGCQDSKSCGPFETAPTAPNSSNSSTGIPRS